MAYLGSVAVTLFAQIGDADQYELGTFRVPLRAQVNGKGFVVDLDTQFTYARSLIETAFADTDGGA